MKISLLLPTRNNFQNLRETISSYIDTAAIKDNVEILLGVDFDDPVKGLVYDEYQNNPNIIIVEFPIRHGYYNMHIYLEELIRKSSGEYVTFSNDDLLMKTIGWDNILQKHSGHFRVIEARVVWISEDGLQWERDDVLFPVFPRIWLDLVGRLATTSTVDSWIWEIILYLNQMGLFIFHKENEIRLDHDRRRYAGVKNGNVASWKEFEQHREEMKKDAAILGEYLIKENIPI